jgi:fibronectin type 3 domain-containing protein
LFESLEQRKLMSTTTYLSDIPTVAEFNGLGPIERDMSVGGLSAGDGNTLQINNVIYQKGLGTSSYSELDYDLSGGNYTTFESDIGIDDETHGHGTVIFQVLLDNVIAFDSGVVTGGTPAQHVSLDLTGVKSLILVVDGAGDGSQNDHADWADAKVTSDDTQPPPGDTGPAAPTDLAASVTSTSEIDLSWTDAATDETGYRVERSTDNVTFTAVTTLPADSTSFADTGLDAETHYYYHVFAFNDAGDSAAASADATTAAASDDPTVSLWDDQAAPAVPADADDQAIEVGMKFRTDVAGEITGLRFYKGDTNTGTHVGNLWAADGTLLATATFAAESASGWQTVTFDQPVTIQPNTTYVASYHTDVGHYSTTENAFGSAGVSNGPLHALANGADGGNGVYVYGASAFPTQTFGATNYWVDVVFAPSSGTPVGTTPAAPTGLTAAASSSSQIDLTWTDNATDETGYRVERSTDGVNFAAVATLDPDSTSYADTGLDASTHYYYQIVAFNADGDSDAASADATTSDAEGPPPPPSGNVTYLSDLTTTAEFNGSGPIERDTSVGGRAAGDGGQISIGGVKYDKGFGTNAYSELDFDLSGGNYKYFQADIGLDDETHGRGSVIFQVLLDGVVAYDSGVVTAGAAKHVGLDVTGVKSLILVVSDGGDGISNDHADWANAQLISDDPPPPTQTAPAAPTDLAAVAVSSSEVDIGWTDRSDNEDGFRVERSTDNVHWTPVVTLGPGKSSFADTGLNAGTHYYYRVFAVNSAGDSDPSNTADDTTKASDVTPPPGGSGRLTGTAFGTAGAWNFSSATFDKALDGDTSTFFDAPTDVASVGLDFGAAKSLSSVRFMPRATLAWRMVGGMFQGSNDSASWTTLATITTQPADGQFTSVPLSGSYRYVRYVSPAAGYGNVSELEFYGDASGTTTPPPDNGGKLTGISIGTDGAWNNGSDTFDKALDGNPNTFFDAPTGVGWVGLDLGSAKVISSVRYIPRATLAWRMVGGMFQGSNNLTSWTTLATVTTQPQDGTFSSLTVTDPVAYRYVRYVSPADGYGNVAEVEFYSGSQGGGTTPPPTGNSVKLTGAGAGSPGAWNFGSDTFDKALDGDTSTFFDAPTANGNFVGLTLAAPTVITSARLFPRATLAWRMTGGKIQGSNDNSTWTDLATVTTQPAEGTFSTVAITDPTAYKYVRYLSPDNSYGNIAELEFYGLA